MSKSFRYDPRSGEERPDKYSRKERLESKKKKHSQTLQEREFNQQIDDGFEDGSDYDRADYRNTLRD